MWHCELGLTVNYGTHALKLRETTRSSTNISELKIAFDGCFDAYDAPVDIMM
jgi:hypothetical protein